MHDVTSVKHTGLVSFKYWMQIVVPKDACKAVKRQESQNCGLFTRTGLIPPWRSDTDYPSPHRREKLFCVHFKNVVTLPPCRAALSLRAVHIIMRGRYCLFDCRAARRTHSVWVAAFIVYLPAKRRHLPPTSTAHLLPTTTPTYTPTSTLPWPTWPTRDYPQHLLPTPRL